MNEESKLSVSFPVMQIRQPIGEFYVGKMSAEDLAEISWFDIRQLQGDSDFADYLGIQRKIDDNRIKEIAQYVKLTDATFPTAVILAVEESCAELKKIEGAPENFYEMTLENKPGDLNNDETVLFRGIARVLDGQHRIKGLRESGRNLDDFDINVCVFVGADIADQASIFATVNLAQTKVNRSLVYDLLSYSQSRSPERTCHAVTVALDQFEKSPFFRRIKRLGVVTPGRRGEFLNQATVVRALLPYLTNDVLRDRDIGKRHGEWSSAESYVQEKLIFRHWFIDEQDEQIAQQMMHYFEAVKRRWPQAWDNRNVGYILARTNGFKAFMSFLRPVYNYLRGEEMFVKMSRFSSVMDRIDLKDEDFNRDNYLPGAVGEKKLFDDLMEKSDIGGYD